MIAHLESWTSLAVRTAGSVCQPQLANWHPGLHQPILQQAPVIALINGLPDPFDPSPHRGDLQVPAGQGGSDGFGLGPGPAPGQPSGPCRLRRPLHKRSQDFRFRRQAAFGDGPLQGGKEGALGHRPGREQLAGGWNQVRQLGAGQPIWKS